MVPDTNTAAIAVCVAGMSAAQVTAVRDGIITEIRSIGARLPAGEPPDDPHRFRIARDRATCARRWREVEYLNSLLMNTSIEVEENT